MLKIFISDIRWPIRRGAVHACQRIANIIDSYRCDEPFGISQRRSCWRWDMLVARRPPAALENAFPLDPATARTAATYYRRSHVLRVDGLRGTFAAIGRPRMLLSSQAMHARQLNEDSSQIHAEWFMQLLLPCINLRFIVSGGVLLSCQVRGVNYPLMLISDNSLRCIALRPQDR